MKEEEPNKEKVMGKESITYKKDEMCFECNGQFDGVNDFFPHIFGNDEGGHHYDDWRRDEPKKKNATVHWCICVQQIKVHTPQCFVCPKITP